MKHWEFKTLLFGLSLTLSTPTSTHQLPYLQLLTHVVAVFFNVHSRNLFLKVIVK